jgi:hypothetical protein
MTDMGLELVAFILEILSIVYAFQAASVLKNGDSSGTVSLLSFPPDLPAHRLIP